MPDEAPESVRETLEAAFSQAEAAAPAEKLAPPPPRQSVNRETSTDRTDSGGDQEQPKNANETQPRDIDRPDRPRDQFGRFQSSSPAGPKPDAARDAQPSDADREADPQTPDQPGTAAQEEADGPPILPPQSWSAAEKESWHSLPRPVQEIVDRREREVSRHLQQRAEQVNVYEPLAQALQPYQQQMAMRGVNPAAVVTQLLAVQDLLERDPVAGVAHVARVYGVDLRNFATAFQQNPGTPQDPAVQQLMERIGRQEQMIGSWQQAAQQQEMARINDEVQAFAADRAANPYFEHVRARMGELMASGAASNLTQAYRLACADNPDIVRAMEQTQRRAENAQRSASERAAAERARRAAVSVTGSPYGGGAAARNGAGRGSLRETLEHAYDAVVNR